MGKTLIWRVSEGGGGLGLDPDREGRGGMVG